MQWMQILWIAAVLLLGPAESVCLAASVEGSGCGISEQAALHDAMRDVVAQQVGAMVDSRTLVRNAQTLNDTIYMQTSGYIRSYQILEQDFCGHLYRIRIRADVSEQLQTDLMTRLQCQTLVGVNLQDPRIGVLAFDRQGQEDSGTENILIDGLQEKGFSRMTDMTQLEASVKRRARDALFQDRGETTQLLEAEFPADFLIMVKIERVSEAPIRYPGFSELCSGHAALAIRMYNLNTGEISYADTVSSSAVHTDASMAAEAAIHKAANLLATKLSQAALRQAANPQQHVRLIVTAGRLGTLPDATRQLEDLPGVQHVFIRDVSDHTMLFDIDYVGTTADFAATLSGSGIEILELSSQYVQI